MARGLGGQGLESYQDVVTVGSLPTVLIFNSGVGGETKNQQDLMHGFHRQQIGLCSISTKEALDLNPCLTIKLAAGGWWVNHSQIYSAGLL